MRTNVSRGRTVYRSQPAGGGQGVGVGVLGVGVAVGYTVTTMIVGVGLAVEAGRLVKVAEGKGKGVNVGGGWTIGAPVGMAVGDGRVVAVGPGLASCVVGVCAATGVGVSRWISTGRSPSANTMAAITVSVTTVRATRPVSNGRTRDASGFCVSVVLFAIILLTLALVGSVRT
jgi:hypothetical protein